MYTFVAIDLVRKYPLVKNRYIITIMISMINFQYVLCSNLAKCVILMKYRP